MNLALRDLRLPLAHFTLELDAVLTGRVTALFGPSGAGKTSLLELIAGLRRPAAGAITLDDRVMTDAAGRVLVPPQQRAIGYVPQENALFPHLNARGNLLYGHVPIADARPGLSLDHVIEVLEIGACIDRPVGSLSGGEQQRVALGRALLARPRLLLLDEPLAGLDHALKDRLMPYLQRIRDEFRLPMIYVTHSPDEVVALCDEALVLEQGRVVRQGAIRDLFAPAAGPRYELRPATPI